MIKIGMLLYFMVKFGDMKKREKMKLVVEILRIGIVIYYWDFFF